MLWCTTYAVLHLSLLPCTKKANFRSLDGRLLQIRCEWKATKVTNLDFLFTACFRSLVCRKATKSIKHLPLLANAELFSEAAPEDYSCRHIEIDLANSGLTYEAGDHLAVYPHNSPSKVERAANRLGINLDRYFSLTPKPGSNGMLGIVGRSSWNDCDVSLWLPQLMKR